MTFDFSPARIFWKKMFYTLTYTMFYTLTLFTCHLLTLS